MARDSIFEEKYIDISIGVIGINQGLIPNFVQDIIDQDNIG